MPPRLAPMPKTADPFYQSAAWEAAKRAKRALGNVWCVVCGSTRRLVLDHRIERKDGGADLPPLDELDWLCHVCHQRKTADARARRARGGR